MLKVEESREASGASNMATQNEPNGDFCFHVPVLLHPHTEALAALLLPGSGRDTDTDGAHKLWRQDSRLQDAISQQRQEVVQASKQGNGNSTGPGVWISPPTLFSLREQARQLQQQRQHIREGHHVNPDDSFGDFGLTCDTQQQQQQQQDSPHQKRLLLDDTRSFTLIGASSSPVHHDNKHPASASPVSVPISPVNSHRREGDGGMVVPIHLMASLLITESSTQSTALPAQRAIRRGFAAGDVGSEELTPDMRILHVAARQSPLHGEVMQHQVARAGEAAVMSGVRAAALGAGSLQSGPGGAFGATVSWAGAGAGSGVACRWPPATAAAAFPETPRLGDVRAAPIGGDDEGHTRVTAQQCVRQPQQRPQELQQHLPDASRPCVTQTRFRHKTSEHRSQDKQLGQQRGQNQHQEEENVEAEEDGDGDGTMLIDTRTADRAVEGALLPTPERPSAISATGSWDALRGLTLSLDPPHGIYSGGAGGAGRPGDGVLGTLALLSPGFREEGSTGLDVAMEEPPPMSGPWGHRAGEVLGNLRNTEQRKDLNAARGAVPAGTELLEVQGGFDADDEGDGAAGARVERARVAYKLTGRSACLLPLPGLDASPPWALPGYPGRGAPPSAAAPRRHGLDCVSSLAMALPPSSHPPKSVALQPLGHEESTTSVLTNPRTTTPTASSRPAAVSAEVTEVEARLPAVSLGRWPGRYNAADVEEPDPVALEELLKLKCSLRRSVQSQNPQAICLILSLLAALPVTVQMLADSQIAALVSPLEYNSNMEVATAARRLSAAWKRILKNMARRSPARDTSTRGRAQQSQLGRPQSRHPMRVSLRAISDHVNSEGTDDPRLNHHEQQVQERHKQQMDVNIRDQTNQPHTQPHLDSLHQHHMHRHHRGFAVKEEHLAPYDLGLQSLSLVRSQSDVLAHSLPAPAAATAATAPATCMDAPCMAHTPANAPRSRHGIAAGTQVQAIHRREQPAQQVRVQRASVPPLQHQAIPGEGPAEAPGSGEGSQQGNGAQVPKRISPVFAVRGTNTALESHTVSEAEGCSSGEDPGAATAGTAAVCGVRLEGSSGCEFGSGGGGAVLGCIVSCSPLSTPKAVLAAAAAGSSVRAGGHGVGSDTRSRAYDLSLRPNGPGIAAPTTMAHTCTTTPASSLEAGMDVPQPMPVKRPGQDIGCKMLGIASPASCMAQLPPAPPQCAISPPAGMIINGVPAAMRPPPPPGALVQPPVRKRKVERPCSRRRSGNPSKRPASSAVLGQGAAYPGGLGRPAAPRAPGGTGGDINSDDQRYHPPSGDPVAGVKTSARSSLLGLHPPSSKRQRHHAGLGLGSTSVTHGGGGSTSQVRHVSLQLSSLDLGSAGEGGEGEGAEASCGMAAMATAAAASPRNADADADMGSQDDGAAMLTSDDDLMRAFVPSGVVVGCAGLGEGQAARLDRPI